MTGVFAPRANARVLVSLPVPARRRNVRTTATSPTTNGASNASNASRASDASDASDNTELKLRAAAMANLQQQLARVESLRADELKTAISRFEELEDALSMAERTIVDLERENAAIKAAARQELIESQALVQKAMQAIEALQVAGNDAGDDAGDDDEDVDVDVFMSNQAEEIIEELEAELEQLHKVIQQQQQQQQEQEVSSVSFEVPPMLSVSELERAVRKLTESQRNLAAAEKDNALLRARVEALERAEREAKADPKGNLAARNKELARLLGGTEAGLEEGGRYLRGVLERLEEVEED
jgi:DNA repair exonuclease SbcCD ATPase subunit